MRDDTPELQEDLAQVVLDRLGAHEELRGGVAVARPGGDELGDAQLLRGEVVDRRRVALARALARGVELAAGALRPEVRADALERLEGRAQLRARLDLAPVAAQALAVGELRAGPLVRRRLAGVQLEGLAEQRLGLVALGEHRAAAGDHPVHGTARG